MSVPLLSPDCLALDLAPGDVDAVLGEVAERLAAHPDVLEYPQFIADLRARERLTSTALGHGIAIPHARTTSVREIVMAAGRSREGIWFETSQQKIHLLFVIGVPPRMVREYLGLLSMLTRRLKEAPVRDALMGAASPAEFLAALDLPQC
jgi:mannitol/fructose-specific phosphotransferase system IIA component (Ntr-type)